MKPWLKHWLMPKWLLLIVIVVLWISGSIGLIIHIRQSIAQPDQSLEIIKTALLLLGGLGVVLPTYLNVWQSIENNQNVQEKIQFDKIENTFRIIEKWDDPALLAARGFARAIGKNIDNMGGAELLQKINSEPGLEESIILIFNYWENVRVSIKANRINEKMLQESVSAMFDQLYDTFKPWVKSRSPQSQKDLSWLHNRLLPPRDSN
jgi:hypothetical protein